LQPYAYEQRAICYQEIDSQYEALKDFNTALSLKKTFQTYLLLAEHKYYKLKDSIGAFEDIKAALNRFSDKPQIYLCRACFWKDRNDYNKEMLDLLKVT
jgi:tetratricopeptide (TPR) repeat protein